MQTTLHAAHSVTRAHTFKRRAGFLCFVTQTIIGNFSFDISHQCADRIKLRTTG
ncbi:MAG: hypothetical protein RLZZ189_2065 [Pseudomonadota bacterium]